MQKNSETLSELVKKARKDRKLSARKLAELCEVSHTEINNIEKGIRIRPAVLTLKGFEKYLIYFFAILMTATNIQNTLVMALQLYSLLALLPISLYNGKRGYKFNKYVFYAFYPVHLIILYAIRLLMLH